MELSIVMCVAISGSDSAYLLKEMRPGDLVEFALIDDFNSDFFTGKHVPCQLDDGEMPSSQCLFQVVQTRDFAIVDVIRMQTDVPG